MGFNREMLPEPQSYFETTGMVLKGRGKWRSTACVFHGGTSSMRVNLETGAWVCMSCAVKGGDVLAYEMQTTGAEFVEASKVLGAWIDEGKPAPKPTPFSARAALSVLAHESNLIVIAASNAGCGVQLPLSDLERVQVAGSRIAKIYEVFNA